MSLCVYIIDTGLYVRALKTEHAKRSVGKQIVTETKAFHPSVLCFFKHYFIVLVNALIKL